MDFRFVAQIIIILIIITISALFINKYFYSKKNIKLENSETAEKDLSISTDNKSIVEKKKSEEEPYNIIEDIEYVSIDSKGNEYTINAETGEVSNDNDDILILYNVHAEIKLVGKSTIYIKSNFANYNKMNFDTKFYEEIIVNYDKNKLLCDNFDIFFKDNRAVMYNNIFFENMISESSADIIIIDLLKGDVEVKMYEENKNVIIKSKEHGNN